MSNLLARKFDQVMLGQIDLLDGKKFNRKISEGRVKKIINKFNPLAANPPILYPLDKVKGDKIYGVIEGQHTLTAMMALFEPDTILNATIVDVQTAKELVDFFKLVNENKKNVNDTEKFWADYFAKDPEVVSIKAIITSNEIAVEKRKKPNIPAIVNVGTLRRLYVKYGVDTFTKTFQTIRQSFWDKGYVQSKAIENNFIIAMIEFCCQYPDAPADIFEDVSAAEVDSRSTLFKGERKSIRILSALKKIYKGKR